MCMIENQTLYLIIFGQRYKTEKLKIKVDPILLSLEV